MVTFEGFEEGGEVAGFVGCCGRGVEAGDDGVRLAPAFLAADAGVLG